MSSQQAAVSLRRQLIFFAVVKHFAPLDRFISRKIFPDYPGRK